MKLLLLMDLLEALFLTIFGVWSYFLSGHDLNPSWDLFVLTKSTVLIRALCVVWTTPLVATLGMSLTIPLAMVADMLIHGRHYSAIYVLGSVQVNEKHRMSVLFRSPFVGVKLISFCPVSRYLLDS